MVYQPRFVDPTGSTFSLSDVIQSDEWRYVDFSQIRPGDRVLCIRVAQGVRMITESIVTELDPQRTTWNNYFGTPVISVLDTQLFIPAEPHDDRFEEDLYLPPTD